MELQVGADHLLLAQELGQGQHQVGGGEVRRQLAGQLDADDFRQAHPRCSAKHHVFRFQATHANGDHAQGIDVRGVAVSAHAGIRVGDAMVAVHHRRHLLQVDLVHDAVTRLDHVDILERFLGPVDEVEAVLVTSVFDGAVLVERLRVIAAALDSQRVVDDQLYRHHRVDLGRVAALVGDGVTQAGEVDQRGLAEDVMAHHARREPREIEVALALDQLAQRGVEGGRVAATHQVFGENARGVRQAVVGAGLDRLDGRARIEVVQVGAWQGLAVCSIHIVIRLGHGTRYTDLANGGAAQSLWERPCAAIGLRSSPGDPCLSAARSARTGAARRRHTRRSGG